MNPEHSMLEMPTLVVPGPHSQPGHQVVAALHSVDTGLTPTQAAERLVQHGPNRIEQVVSTSLWMRVLRQFNNLLIYVLLVAALVTFWLRDYLDAAVILGVVVINAVIGFVQEGKAERALEAVRALLASRATVLRGGDRHEIDAADLVPGDVVLLESGARVPADLRLLRIKNLRIDESALTGESVPAEKDAEPVAADAPLGDRLCMAFAGTTVAVGQASGVVVATARQTEIGKIGALVSDLGSLATPL
ncbi:MAG: HAD-IC family P-type ATPase, partial [Hydrogenophaga sp.]